MNHTETLRRHFRAYSDHDLETLLATLADNVTVRFPTSPEPICGKEQLRPVWARVLDTVIPDVRQTVQRIVVEGDTAATEFTETGTVVIPEGAAAQLEPGGRPYSLDMVSFYHFDDEGRIDRIRSYWDTADFATQLGIDIAIIRALQASAHSA
ncbi:nuclear transport factor 2 family protein [Nocardia sp. NPDC004604]|uniref:nuclear transport factor 2 family protein n=1 Tax=Nocardia sp. NPDC004604 TaxID=3157013 RepID=UPI0033A9A7DE